MNKNDVKSVLEFLSKEEKIESVLPKVSEEALKIYEDFGKNPLDMYSLLTEEYKDKMAEVIADELKIMYNIIREGLEKPGEQKPVAKYKVGDTIYYNSFGRLVSFVIANIVEDGTDNPMYEDKDGNSVFQNDIVEQKSADKVEPKFRIGDWVVFNNKHQSIYQVKKIEDGYYILRHTHGGTFRVCVLHDESLRPWTIQDAKDGDVLACNEEILLFKSYSVQGRISLYCWYNGQTNNFHSKEVVDTLMTTRNKICPATKEQRNLLFQKTKEAGYEWDAEKKELKKIEQIG